MPDYFVCSTDFGDIPSVGAQELTNILKQGYLEKKRKGITEHVPLPHPYVSSLLITEIANKLFNSSRSTSDHSFFGSEWQKRWCVLNNSVFYYFGSEKGVFVAGMEKNITAAQSESNNSLTRVLLPADKQQKGSFYIGDYTVKMANLKKDKKNACFEFTAPGRRAFQVGSR